MTRPKTKRSVSVELTIAALLAVLPLLGVGCTSDDPNELGGGLVDPDFSQVLEALSVEDVTAYSAFTVEESDRHVGNMQTLYLGQQEGTASSILVNFDFGNVYTEAYPQERFTSGNITGVDLSLTKLKFYGTPPDGVTSVTPVYYSIRMLDAPFDTTSGFFPGPVPAFGPVELNQDYGASESSGPLLELDPDQFLQWLAAGDTLGLVISAGPESDPGLVGFGARELSLYSQLNDIAVGTVVAPNLVVAFADTTVNFLLPPVADTSTFHAVAEPPASLADGMMLRTGLRRYPALVFDFSGLPANAFINRAVLRVTSDTLTSFGNLESIVVAELDSTLFGDPFADLPLDELQAGVYGITGQANIDPRSAVDLGFDVTTAVQRIVNSVYAGRRGLVLSAGEDFFPRYDLTSVDPDFYVTQFDFYGTGAAPEMRPRLEITYSRIEELEGGAK